MKYKRTRTKERVLLSFPPCDAETLRATYRDCEVTEADLYAAMRAQAKLCCGTCGYIAKKHDIVWWCERHGAGVSADEGSGCDNWKARECKQDAPPPPSMKHGGVPDWRVKTYERVAK